MTSTWTGAIRDSGERIRIVAHESRRDPHRFGHRQHAVLGVAARRASRRSPDAPAHRPGAVLTSSVPSAPTRRLEHRQRRVFGLDVVIQRPIPRDDARRRNRAGDTARRAYAAPDSSAPRRLHRARCRASLRADSRPRCASRWQPSRHAGSRRVDRFDQGARGANLGARAMLDFIGEQTSRGCRRSNHGVRLDDLDGDRFFDQHVRARAQGVEGERRVERMRRQGPRRRRPRRSRAFRRSP